MELKHSRAVLLDVDGTLIDSNDAHANAWVDVGKEFGYDIDFDRVRWLIGMGGDKVLPELTGLSEDSKEGTRILERRGEIFRNEYLPKLRPFARAHELLERFVADGYQLVVATSASEKDLGALLKQGGFDDIIKKATSSDDAEESKPAPDIVQAALQKGQVRREDAIMLGDTPYDVGAARRAGVAIVGLRSGGWRDDEMHGVVSIYDDAADLLAHYSDSPFSKK